MNPLTKSQTRFALVKAMMKHINYLLEDERGANQIVILAVIMGALALVPIFFDFASVHYGRRTAQTGADAASLAAAKEYAIALSNPPPFAPDWVGFCGEIEPNTIGRYVNYVEMVAWSSMGLPPAQSYAAANNSNVVEFQSELSPRYKVVNEVSIPFVKVYVKTNKKINLLLQHQYGEEFQAPAKANAEVYLDSHQHWAVPCRLGDETKFINYYRFFWKIKLIGVW